MIPATNGFLNADLEITEQPSKTYGMNMDTGKTITGYVDGAEAMKQAIYKILSTERYAYVMYPWSYGIELQDLFGEPVSYVCPELERRITEALTQDDRVTEVTDYEFDLPKPGIVHVTFIVHTKFGNINAEKEVNI